MAVFNNYGFAGNPFGPNMGPQNFGGGMGDGFGPGGVENFGGPLGVGMQPINNVLQMNGGGGGGGGQQTGPLVIRDTNDIILNDTNNNNTPVIPQCI